MKSQLNRVIEPKNPEKSSRQSDELAVLSCVSVVILSCNREEELRQTLNRLKIGAVPWHEVIVVDNASTDASIGMVEAEYPEVKLITCSKNQGVKAINQGYQAATGRWVLSLDDDSAPLLSSWTHLCSALKTDPDYAVIGLSILSSIHTRNEAQKSAATESSANVIQPGYSFSQAGSLFNKQALNQIGGYDETLFLWGVELHWIAKALTHGYSIALCNSAAVVHRATPLNRSSQRHAYYYCRNLLLFLLYYCPNALLYEQVKRYCNDILRYSWMHKTTLYLRALREAFTLARQSKAPTKRLTPEQFQAIKPDLKASFAYLG